MCRHQSVTYCPDFRTSSSGILETKPLYSQGSRVGERTGPPSQTVPPQRCLRLCASGSCLRAPAACSGYNRGVEAQYPVSMTRPLDDAHTLVSQEYARSPVGVARVPH